MELICRSFEELSVRELYEILKLRVDVFVVEQNCPYEELDRRDFQAMHIFMKDEDGIEAYLRVMERGVQFEDAAAIGRVVVRRRRQGYGTALLAAGIKCAETKMNAKRIRLEAQTYAVKFYENAGFQICSEPFLEDGIPHVQMMRQ
ncbi:MAG: GNAT family N-acetyltransferase [Erysipelotrichia bacterium]|nr:GNAT family N-acetyltransferase [Erysipelotrichia bacterium]